MREQTSFFNNSQENNKARPLASRMRPQNVAEIVGQDHLLSKGKTLRRMIESDMISSMILYGPPGSGKTTLAYVISKSTDCEFLTLNATASGVKDIRLAIESAVNTKKFSNKKTILFIDEIHRFNTAQQDALLPYVEDGVVIIIGATTENPYFEINSPLISRLTVFVLKELTQQDIEKILYRAISDKINGYGNYSVMLDKKATRYIAQISSGDTRSALNLLELAVLTTEVDSKNNTVIDLKTAQECAQKRMLLYDKDGDNHYDTISAFIKSMRGSNPDAAVFYLAKMLTVGEEIKFIARRMIIFASEDVGNADINALNIAVNAFNAASIVGLPEARIILSQAAIYLSCAPKSNACYLAIENALADIQNGIDATVPMHLRDSSYKNKEKFGYGIEYKYPHNYENGYVAQEYLPKDVRDKKYYYPKSIGYEEVIRKHLQTLDNKNNQK
jgi:putative ATPase